MRRNTIKVINDESYVILDKNHSVIEIFSDSIINNLEINRKFIFNDNLFMNVICDMENDNMVIYTNMNLIMVYDISDIFMSNMINNIDMKFINYSDYLSELTLQL